MKILIDEDLSPKIAEWLRVHKGIDALHVRDRGLLGKVDPVILEIAYCDDRILVTANVKDFRRLARQRELHPGIVFFLHGNLKVKKQLELMRIVMEALEQELEAGRDMVNRALEIEFDGKHQFYDLYLFEAS